MFVSYLRVDGHDEFDELDGLEFFDGLDFFDGFDSRRPLAPNGLELIMASTGLLDLNFDDFAGLADLSLIDDLDLIRFLTIFNFSHSP